MKFAALEYKQEASARLLSSCAPPRWPFWKTVPRYGPEYTVKDLICAVKALARSPESAGHLTEFCPGTERLFLGSGRECLFVILNALGLRPQSRVGVPLYCCSSVFEAIVAAGHTPVFLDLDLATYSLDLESLRRNRDCLDALVIIHAFGYPTDMAALRACLGAHRIPVIEDCAHALFSEYRGRPLGTHTEASFFSFGLHKPAAAGGGGIAFFNDPALARTSQKMLRPARQSLARELRHVAACCARAMAYQRAVYGALLASPLGSFRDRVVRNDASTSIRAEFPRYAPTRMGRCDRDLLAGRLCEFRAKLPLLARNSQRLRNAVQGTSLETPAEPAYGTWNHFLLPVRYRDANGRKLGRQYLAQQRIDSAPLYGNCVQSAVPFGYRGGCPNTELAAQTVCTIPNHWWLSDKEIEFIGERLRTSTEVV